MNRLLVEFLLVVTCLVPNCPAQDTSQTPPIQVYFSPKGGCTEAVVRELNAARSSVLVQAYSFTSTPIAKALLEAHKRGVNVQVILDKSQRTEKYSEADFLVNVGIPTRIDAQHAIAHNKIMVIDGTTVVTGSFSRGASGGALQQCRQPVPEDRLQSGLRREMESQRAS